jgi:hypothetical protein
MFINNREDYYRIVGRMRMTVGANSMINIDTKIRKLIYRSVVKEKNHANKYEPPLQDGRYYEYVLKSEN